MILETRLRENAALRRWMVSSTKQQKPSPLLTKNEVLAVELLLAFVIKTDDAEQKGFFT